MSGFVTIIKPLRPLWLTVHLQETSFVPYVLTALNKLNHKTIIPASSHFHIFTFSTLPLLHALLNTGQSAF